MNLQKLYELRVAEKQAGDFISTLPTLDKSIVSVHINTDSTNLRP